MKLISAAFLALCSVGSARADDLLWARKSMLGGGMTTISTASDGTLFCTGCNINIDGPIPIRRTADVDAYVIGNMQPCISTLWIVVFRVDQGNTCEGEFYAVSLNTHTLQHLDTSRLGCGSLDLAMAEKGVGAVVTFTNQKGQRVVQEVK